MDIDAFLRDTVLAHIPGKRHSIPLILFDECANHPHVIQVARAAIRTEHALASRCAWSQLRQKSDGSFVHVEGYRRGVHLPVGEEWGTPVKGWKFSDYQIIDSIVSNFIMADRIVFLSENTRNDEGGVRRLLEETVKPAMVRYNHDRFGLLALMKKGKTDWATYAQELLNALRNQPIGIGYEYRLV